MIFRKIIDLGIDVDVPFYQKREIRMVNLFALITLCGLVVGATSLFFLGSAYPAITETFAVSITVLIIIFNAKKWHEAATFLFVISINLLIFLINQQYDVSVACYLYYFPVIFCVALLHNPDRSNLRTALFLVIVLSSFLCAKLLNIQSIKNLEVTSTDNKVLLIYNAYLTVFLTVFLVYLVVKLINRQNDELLLSLQKEKDSQVLVSNSLKEKEVLLAEIQHRVKNNLAVITGLLNLQTEKAPCEVSKQLMIESRNRVMSISMVHERLYKNGDLSRINFKLYLSQLIKEVVKSFSGQVRPVEIHEELDTVELEITKAVPIGLIINEAITNSLKHAFSNSLKDPVIKIKMNTIHDRILISLSDNGVGFIDIQNRKDNSLGITLIESLADQVDAKVAFRNEEGASLNLVFGV